MSARVERTVPAQRIRTEQVVVNFDAELLKAPFSLRCGAILIDYIILVSVPVLSLISGKLMGIEPSKLLNSEISNAGLLITILLLLTNFVVLPTFSGQSVGKMLTGLKIVKIDGSAPSLGAILVRHLIGYPLSFLIFGLGFLLAVLNSKGRALHDFLAGTVVVYGTRQRKVVQNERL